MDFIIKRKKIFYGFCGFLMFMLIGTVVSKGIYASRLAKVTVEVAKSMVIEHKVEVDGMVKPGKELAVNTLEGIRVKEIFVREGETVEAGTLLFQVDQDDVKEKMKEAELEIQKYETQIIDLQTEQATAILKQQVGQNRATEDYYLTEEKLEEKIKDAREDYESAKEKLRDCKNQKPKVDLGDDEDEEDYPEILEWRAKVEVLEEKVKEAEKGKKAAILEKEEELLKAKRNYENAQEPADLNIVIQTNELEKQAKKDSLSKYKTILAKGGKVVSEAAGLVTKINVAPGQRTLDQPAILLADASTPFQFETTVNKDQKKYVNQGDPITLKLGNQEKIETEVDYLVQNETNPDQYEVTVYLEEGVGAVGAGGTLTSSYSTEKFDFCIPIEALRGESGKYYIYKVGEKNSILGKEFAVEMQSVRLIDKNESFAAIDVSGIDENTQIIVTSTKEIENGDVIRY